jgi:spermidine synthase
MIPWVLIDVAKVPDQGGELRLMRRGEEFSIMAGAIELMSSRLSGSEEALAALACDHIAGRPKPRLLIGGFGMGFTLRAALARLGPRAQVSVAELVPAVIAWAKGPMAHLSAACLDDPRVTVHAGDVGDLIRAHEARWDAILLDVDNGPEALSRRANDRLYDAAGLLAAGRALKPGGVLAVWSSARHAPFVRRLQQAGFTVQEHAVRASGGKRGARHLIWLASLSALA